MIRLRLLGALDIEADAGIELRSLVAHPKRLALLAYLALRADHTPLSRDSLLPVFWPESDEARARGALRNALHFLRSRLGKETIDSQGHRLRLEGVWCDVTAFEELLERGGLEGALELYRGDLLEGFFLSDAPEFEVWLEEERGRLRRRAVDTCWGLVDEAERSGRVPLAARYARRALALVPTDEVGARRLISLLAREGDTAGALRAHDEFADRLRRLYEIEPSDETHALAEAVRQGRVERAPLPAARISAPEDSLTRQPNQAEGRAAGGAARIAAEDRRPGSGEVERRLEPIETRAVLGEATRAAAFARGDRRDWRTALGWALPAAAVAVIAVALGSSGRRQEEAVAASPAESVLAVLPFTYQGADPLAFLGEGVARLVSDALNGAGSLRAVDHHAIGSFARRELARDPDTDPGPATAIRFGAGHFVVGDVFEQDSTVRVTIALRRTDAAPDAPGHTATVEGLAGDIFALADALARQLLVGLGHDGLERSAVRAGTPLESLKAFMRGEAAARAGWFREAMDEFAAAVREDSTFALAHYGLSAAAYGAGVGRIPRSAAEAARRHSADLPRSDQLFLEAWANHLDARVPEAETFYRQAAALRPTHVDSWRQLGELLFHWGPSTGAAASSAQGPFEQALALEPDDAGSALHLARILAGDSDRDGVRELASIAGENASAAWTLEMEALDAFLSDDRRLREDAMEAITATTDRSARRLLTSVATNTPNLDAAASLARALLAPRRGAVERAMVRSMLVRIELARGHLTAARQEVDQAPELSEATRREFAAALELLPFIPTDSARYTLIERQLSDPAFDAPLPSRTDPVRMGSGSFPPLRWEGSLRETRLLLLGLWRARAGRAEMALRIALEIEDLAPGDGAAAYPGLIRATVALEASDPEGALAALGPVRRPPNGRFESHREYGRPLERWLRAEALALSGRPRDALRWFSTFPDQRGGDLWYVPHAYLRRAELHDGLGEAGPARDLYRRFLERVQGAEGYLQSETQRAMEAIARLSG
ncbi:MAG: BTAD domain-containing putative transcriptional regulator [Gemmatimonadota bacterium]